MKETTTTTKNRHSPTLIVFVQRKAANKISLMTEFCAFSFEFYHRKERGMPSFRFLFFFFFLPFRGQSLFAEDIILSLTFMAPPFERAILVNFITLLVHTAASVSKRRGISVPCNGSSHCGRNIFLI